MNSTSCFCACVCFVWTPKNQHWYLLSAFLTFLSVVKISWIFHPPTCNIGGSSGMLHNLWIGIRECGRSLPTWKVSPTEYSPSAIGGQVACCLQRLNNLLDKAPTKTSPSPLAQFLFHSYSMISSLEFKFTKYGMNTYVAPGVFLSTELDKTDTCPVLHSLLSGLMGGGA